MFVMALLNVILGGVVGRRCPVMMLAPLSVIAGLEGLLCSQAAPTWTTVAWHAGVLVFFLDIGYLAGSAYAVYGSTTGSPRLKISTAPETSTQ
jgi:hypothetical protein